MKALKGVKLEKIKGIVAVNTFLEAAGVDTQALTLDEGIEIKCAIINLLKELSNESK